MQLDLLARLDHSVDPRRTGAGALLGRPTAGPGQLRIRLDGGWLELAASRDTIDSIRVAEELHGEELAVVDTRAWFALPGSDLRPLAPYVLAPEQVLDGRVPQRATVRGQLVLLDAPTGDLLVDVSIHEGRMTVASRHGGWPDRSLSLPVICSTYLRLLAWHDGRVPDGGFPTMLQGSWPDVYSLIGGLGVGPFVDWCRSERPGPGALNVMSGLVSVR